MDPTTTEQLPLPKTIRISLSDLQNNTIPLSTLESAFGPNSLGLILVDNLPPEYPTLREKLLSYSSYLANLPGAELSKLEVPAARYNIGWSCGKEKLDSGDFDTLKGSYYVQPIHDAELESKAKNLYGSEVPDMTTSNVWPGEDVLPGFEKNFEELCGLIVDVAGLVARQCDRFGMARLEGYREGTLERIVRGSVSTKARLLHYFPPKQNEDMTTSGSAQGKFDDVDTDTWCGLHHDLGALTGLTSNMYIDESSCDFSYPYPRPHPRNTDPSENEKEDDNGTLSSLPELPQHPDPSAGLWIKDRSGRATQVHIPRDCLAFQTGEALQMITRGKFRAVPHFVRGGETTKRIARNTLAVFTQPNLWEVVDEETGMDFAGLCGRVFERTY